MKCSYCGTENAVPIFFDSGSRVGCKGVCRSDVCIRAHEQYMRHTNFGHIADFNEERKCPIVGVDGIGHIICFFLSIKEAAHNGHNEWQLHLCLQRPHRKHHGLFWRRMSDIIVALD